MELKQKLIITLDIIIYIIILIAWRFVDSTVPKIQRGFFCGNPSLSLPYKKSTIRGIWLHINFYGVPLLICVVECLLNPRRNLRKSLIRSSTWFKHYFFTFISLMILMSTIKNLSGVHRPFFFDICKPDLAVNCTTGAYVSSDFKCTNSAANAYLLSESTRSFPSGHVVSVVYACACFMWYLQRKFLKFSTVLTFIHLVMLLWIAVCSVTRVTDNWHHVTDIVGGIILPLPFVYYACRVLCKDFKDEAGLVKSKQNQDPQLSMDQ